MREYKIIGVMFFVVVVWLFNRSVVIAFQIDINDILDQKFMPTRLFMYGSFLNLNDPQFVIDRNDAYQWPHKIGSAGASSDFNGALEVMTFHRQMMTEYLATDYLAKQLLTRRMGKIQVEEAYAPRNGTKSSNQNLTELYGHRRKARHISNNRLLMDEGSINYRDWLERSTLEDVQRHFERSTKANKSNDAVMLDEKKPYRLDGNHRRNIMAIVPHQYNMANENEDFEDGDITGYALSNGIVETSQSRLNSPNHLYDMYNNGQESIPLAQIVNKNGYDTAYDSYAIHSPHSHHSHAPSYPQPHPHSHSHSHPYSHAHQHSSYHPPSHQPTPPPPPSSAALEPAHTKEISLKDITDIALTTLAFLSFGMFILQVLLCITMGKDDSANMMMMPMDGDDNVVDISSDTEEIRRRRKRSAEIDQRLILMNDLARRVLHSVNAVLLMPKDNGSCHYFSLCQNNKFARTLLNGQRLWIPVWSLGLSWLTSRLHKNEEKRSDYGSILKSLKASVVGLANGNCQQHYGNGCQP